MLKKGGRVVVGWVKVADERETDAPAVVWVVVEFVVLGVAEDPATVVEAETACCSLVTRILFLPVD